jgi:hypothetical protein
MARGGQIGHGLPKVLSGPLHALLFYALRPGHAGTALQPFQGWLARKAGGLRPSSMRLDTPRRKSIPEGPSFRWIRTANLSRSQAFQIVLYDSVRTSLCWEFEKENRKEKWIKLRRISWRRWNKIVCPRIKRGRNYLWPTGRSFDGLIMWYADVVNGLGIDSYQARISWGDGGTWPPNYSMASLGPA